MGDILRIREAHPRRPNGSVVGTASPAALAVEPMSQTPRIPIVPPSSISGEKPDSTHFGAGYRCRTYTGSD